MLPKRPESLRQTQDVHSRRGVRGLIWDRCVRRDTGNVHEVASAVPTWLNLVFNAAADFGEGFA